jgi:hypothetical protein
LRAMIRTLRKLWICAIRFGVKPEWHRQIDGYMMEYEMISCLWQD